MQKPLTTLLGSTITICRNTEVRGLFLIGYLLLLMWPFFTTEALSLWLLYRYYHSIWGILVIGLVVQGYLVLTSEQKPKEDNHD